MGALFSCMKNPKDGIPQVEITVRANCCNRKTIKIQLDDLSNLPQVLQLVRSLSKRGRDSATSSLAGGNTDLDSLKEPYSVNQVTPI